MKKSCAVFLFLILIASSSAQARYYQGDEIRSPVEYGCHLSSYQKTELRQKVEKLTMRLFLSSMDALDHPDEFLTVKSEVKREISRLLHENGLTCMLDLGLPASIALTQQELKLQG